MLRCPVEFLSATQPPECGFQPERFGLVVELRRHVCALPRRTEHAETVAPRRHAECRVCTAVKILADIDIGLEDAGDGRGRQLRPLKFCGIEHRHEAHMAAAEGGKGNGPVVDAQVELRCAPAAEKDRPDLHRARRHARLRSERELRLGTVETAPVGVDVHDKTHVVGVDVGYARLEVALRGTAHEIRRNRRGNDNNDDDGRQAHPDSAFHDISPFVDNAGAHYVT